MVYKKINLKKIPTSSGFLKHLYFLLIDIDGMPGVVWAVVAKNDYFEVRYKEGNKGYHFSDIIHQKNSLVGMKYKMRKDIFE